MAFSEKQPPEQSHGAESVGDHVGSDAKSNKSSMASKQPAGGLDSTPIPSAPPGYTVKITFHRATNLPMADINSLSSDPYVLAQINTSLPSRHKEDPPLRLRTPTVRRSTDPEWNCEWIVANIPKDGLTLKARIYDEDPADHDDRLGNVHVHIGNVDGGWGGIKEQAYKIKKRAGSKRAYMVRAVTACVSRAEDMHGYLYVSVEMLGRTEGDNGARCYTVGPPWWTRHYSPLLGRIANRKEPNEDQKGGGKKAEKYKYVLGFLSRLKHDNDTLPASKQTSSSSKVRSRPNSTTATWNSSPSSNPCSPLPASKASSLAKRYITSTLASTTSTAQQPTASSPGRAGR